MNEKEWIKSGIFVGVALLLVFFTVATMPKTQTVKDVEAGNLFEKFKNPAKAASLEIVRVNEDSKELEKFKVERTKRGWTIPSHDNYSADAEDQMTAAATLLVGMEIEGIQTKDSDMHAAYGVVEPTEKNVRDGELGIGSLVRVADSKGKLLASLVIGKEVKGEDEQRYVRDPKQDAVYRATLDIDKLSTKFEDWIEQDLLDLNSFDVEEVTIKDYTMQDAGRYLSRVPRMDATVKEDGSDWEVVKLVYYSPPQGPNQPYKPNEAFLSEVEELDEEKLDDLKSALGDVEIVNVERKPKSLGADLKAGASFADDREAGMSLARRGFYPIPISQNKFDIIGDSGELFATTKDGVQYLLRFGGPAGTEEGTDKLNRYLMVSVQTDESRFPVPEKPAELIEAEKKENGEEEKNPASDSTGDESKEKATEKADEKSTDANDEDQKDDAEVKSGDKEPAEGDEKDSDKKKEEEEEKEEVDLDEIRKEYDRELEKYKEDREKADEKVRELNARFHDWYYVISEDMYKKMRLGRSNLIKESDSAVDKGFNIDSFRKLETEGLKKEESGEKKDDA